MSARTLHTTGGSDEGADYQEMGDEEPPPKQRLPRYDPETGERLPMRFDPMTGKPLEPSEAEEPDDAPATSTQQSWGSDTGGYAPVAGRADAAWLNFGGCDCPLGCSGCG